MITERYSPEKRLQIYATALNDWSIWLPVTFQGFDAYFSKILIDFSNPRTILPELYSVYETWPEYMVAPSSYTGRQQRKQCLLEAINEVIKLIPKPIKK